MKVIRNSVIPFGKRYGAINLFGVLFAKRDMHLSGEVMNHEWLIRLVQSQGNYYEAYRRISFEREAYEYCRDPGYLSRRRCFAQWRK